jgi:glycine cleavage system aminomethyltransferase T
MNLLDRITPLEFWRSFVDLDGADFIGRDALLRVQGNGGPRRKIVGLVGSSSRPLPSIDDRWDLFDGEELVGSTRWVVGSPALGRNIAMGLLDVDYAQRLGHEITLVHSEGEEKGTRTS